MLISPDPDFCDWLGRRWFICRAHEVVENLPINGGSYHCMRCGRDGSLFDMFRNPETRCVPHWVAEGDGWLPEC